MVPETFVSRRFRTRASECANQSACGEHRSCRAEIGRIVSQCVGGRLNWSCTATVRAPMSAFLGFFVFRCCLISPMPLLPRILILAAAVALAERCAAAADRAVDFDRRVAPVLAAHCLECHSGPAPKGGLDLSRQDRAFAGGESGPAIVAGKPDESLLLQRIADGEMPPKKPLPAEEVALLKEWIAGGAAWGTSPIDPFRATTSTRAGYDWWSLQPFARPNPPAVERADFVRNPIDSFVLAKLESVGLAPSPEADRRTLIRRVTFDLTGLPPTPEEVAAFVSDPDALAYEKLVDRLLASPHLGEKWARHWLDLARFGESNGFEYDEPRRNAWPYRDWVIGVLNDDLPFDEFARRQVAGDVLAPGDPRAITATGFLVAGAYDTAGQNQQSAAMKAVVRQDELEDVISTVSQTFLGLTAHCARCHDHKFDPIRQSEYYQLASALGGVRHGERDLTTPAERQELQRLAAEREERLQVVGARLEAIDEPVREQILAERQSAADAPRPGASDSRDALPRPVARWEFDRDLRDAEGAMHGRAFGGAVIRRSGLHLDGKKAYVATPPIEVDLRAKTLEVWVSLETLEQSGGGVISVQTLDGAIFDAIVFAEREPACWMAGSNNFGRTESFHAPRETEADKRPVVITITYAEDGTITCYRDGRRYGTSYRKGEPVTFRAGQAQVLFGLRHGSPGGNRMFSGVIERAQVYDRALTSDEVAASARRRSEVVPEAAILVKLSPDVRAERKRLLSEYRELLRRQQEPLERLVYAVAPRQPESTHRLVRGDTRQPAEVVSPGGIASLVGVQAAFGLPDDAPEAERRAALAQWLTSPQNPLFARVIVNRLWQHHFGAGLVETPNDFGFNGGRPSHPELLNWLAATLVERNWSLKELHREIVLSAAYRQAFRADEAALKQDADNRLLWRRSPQRLEAEAIRDAMLEIAGDLGHTIGGPGFTDTKVVLRSGTYTYDQLDRFDPSFNRRSIYRTWYRGGRNGLLDAFDCPDPSVTAPKRAVTTTPLQALALLNDSFILRMANRLEERARQEAGDDPERQVAALYQWSYGREPTPDEQSEMRRFVAEHGLAALARAIFNSNEFLYVD